MTHSPLKGNRRDRSGNQSLRGIILAVPGNETGINQIVKPT